MGPIRDTGKSASSQYFTMLFWALLALGALDRLGILTQFATVYAGIDDALIWSIAVDYGHGVFHEPFMYGQNYNLMLEALIGAPFVRFLDPWAVLPVITSILALLPFWSTAFWCQREGYLLPALLFVLCPLLLPVEWGMLTSMPRGFVSGLALLSLLPWTLRMLSMPFRAFTVTFILSLAALCSSNVLFPGVLFFLWLVTEDRRSGSFWLFSLLGVIPAAFFQWYGSTFFIQHPWDLVHPMDASDLSFHFGLLADGLAHLDLHFRQLFPLPDQAGWGLTIILLLALALLIRQWRWRPAGLLATTVILIVLALGITKVHDGCESVFFPLSRMFLGLPLTATIAWAMVLRDQRVPGIALVLIGILSAVLVVVKYQVTPRIVAWEMDHQGCAPVAEARIQDLQQLASQVAAAAANSGADLVVPIRWPNLHLDHAQHFQAHFITYACPVLQPGLPTVLGADFDRRSWLKDRYLNSKVGTVLFVGGDPAMWASTSDLNSVQVPDSTLELHLVQTGDRTVGEVLNALRRSH